jgi:hypothetical protein
MTLMTDPESAPEEAAADPEDLKARFRTALDRKKAEHLNNAAESAARDGSKIHGEHGKVGGGRTFRRMSGG